MWIALSDTKNISQAVEAAATGWATRQQFPVNEPFLIQIDNDIRDIILEVAESEKAPELKSLILRTSHLERTTTYDKYAANSKYMDTMHHLSKLKARYKRNSVIVALLNNLEGTLFTIVKGDGYLGSRVRSVVKVAGADKTLNLLQPERDKKRRSIL